MEKENKQGEETHQAALLYHFILEPAQTLLH